MGAKMEILDAITKEIGSLSGLLRCARKLAGACPDAQKLLKAAWRSLDRCQNLVDELDEFGSDYFDPSDDVVVDDRPTFIDSLLSDPPPPPVAIDGPIGGVSPFIPNRVAPAVAGHFENGKKSPAQTARKARRSRQK
jgi:hypothetical protein